MLDMFLGVCKLFGLWMLFETVAGLQGVLIGSGITGLG